MSGQRDIVVGVTCRQIVRERRFNSKFSTDSLFEVRIWLWLVVEPQHPVAQMAGVGRAALAEADVGAD